MHTTSIGSHRAFMVISVTLMVLIVFGLVIGWKYYSDNIAYRQDLIRMDQEVRSESGATSSGLVNLGGPTLESTARSAPLEVGYGEVLPQTTANAQSLNLIEPLPLDDTSAALRQAENLMETYWRTENWRDRVAMVHNPDKVQTLMEDFYETQGGKDPVRGSLTGRGHFRINGKEVLVFNYSGNRPTGLEFAMRKQSDGRYLLDWESYVGYSEIAWPQLIEKRPTAPTVIRAFVKIDDYYNFEFADSRRYLSIRLNSPEGDQ
ncbi:MAG: hypothetical protein KDK97_19890 [Verrucomicrobiales bacterium]|nr:hypothetical protein [Verrucomicrobiales bacterium]